MSQLMKEKKRQDRAGSFKRLVRQFGWAMQTADTLDEFAAATELQMQVFVQFDELLNQYNELKEKGNE